MSGLPREVIRWLQSLDLTNNLRNVRRDFSNGYLVAEILAWYYPQKIQMYSYSNGASLQEKLGNWQQLERIFTRQNLDIPKELIEGTIHCKPLAAIFLVETIYCQLTHRELHYCPANGRPTTFNDALYQSQLPPHARSTASKSIKNNLTITELQTEQDRTHCALKTQAILELHSEQKQKERVEFPDRFVHKRVMKKSSPGKAIEPTKLPEIVVKQKSLPLPPAASATEVT